METVTKNIFQLTKLFDFLLQRSLTEAPVNLTTDKEKK